MSDSSKQTEKKIHEGIDKASDVAKDEVTRLRNELNELRRKAGPKVQEAENFLTSPPVLGFIEEHFANTRLHFDHCYPRTDFFTIGITGFVAGAAVVLLYAKYNGGLRL
ncbi:hypothetical protein INT44_002921 [Umbelopsis vinacea]|uniref:Uncharacterized protein n=1 Tax=Umbelopsis vinacea TaxID=44442 RepID=A0A8H7UKN6_9FUNG|nr:hypothetical protein INT44_002921 [Umbelopsis vinacea]